MKADTTTKKKPCIPVQSESSIQIACVGWFKMQYRNIEPLLFAVPNGGKRQMKTIIKKGVARDVPIEAIRMGKEGLTSGVSDLILLIARGEYSSLCIEMKSKIGTQSPEQKSWQKQAEKHGNKYAVCHSLEQFMTEINNYLKLE